MSNVTSVNNAVANLANELFRHLDSNGDGRLNSTEFQSFLETLLQHVDNKRVPGAGAPIVAREATPRVYAPMEGFNTEKLNNPNHTTPKYVFARATQDLDVGVTRASRSAALEQIAQYVRERGYPNAVVTNDDEIQFGDGFGPIDVLTAGGNWWWGADSPTT
jgi:hypothetical protein